MNWYISWKGLSISKNKIMGKELKVLLFRRQFQLSTIMFYRHTSLLHVLHTTNKVAIIVFYDCIITYYYCSTTNPTPSTVTNKLRFSQKTSSILTKINSFLLGNLTVNVKGQGQMSASLALIQGLFNRTGSVASPESFWSRNNRAHPYCMWVEVNRSTNLWGFFSVFSHFLQYISF